MDYSPLAINIFNKHAQSYQDKFMDISSYQKSLDIFCASIVKEDASLLDVACGPGNVTRYILQKHPGFRMLGIDLAENMIALAKENNSAAEFRIMDGRNINELKQKYDGIICAFGLPYFSKKEAIEFIHDATQLLTDNGVLYLSTMEDNYSKSGTQTNSHGEQLYMYYHEADYLQEAISRSGLQIMDLQRIPYKDGEREYTDLVMVAGKVGS